MDKNKTNQEKAPEIGTQWAGPKSNVPCSVERIVECNGDLIVAIGGMHIPLARFHEEWRPCTIISDDSRTMKEKRIKELVMELQRALDADVTASLAVIEARIAHEALRAATILAAGSNGEIDGDNKEIRDQQTKHVLASSADIEEDAAALAELEQRAAHAKVRSEVARAEVGLYKALLYSQAPRT